MEWFLDSWLSFCLLFFLVFFSFRFLSNNKLLGTYNIVLHSSWTTCQGHGYPGEAAHVIQAGQEPQKHVGCCAKEEELDQSSPSGREAGRREGAEGELNKQEMISW
jgi:hypothetical protein